MALTIQRINFDPATGDNPSEGFMKMDLNIVEIATSIDGDGTPDNPGIESRLAAVEGVADGLGDAATKDVGTGAGTVAAGDDARITGALQKSGGTITGNLSVSGTCTTGPLTANAVNLPTTQFQTVQGAYVGCNTGNAEQLRTYAYRTVAGSGYGTAVWRMQRVVDATVMGFLQFGDEAGNLSEAVAIGNANGRIAVGPGGNTTVVGSINPSTDNSRLLGGPSLRWNTVYAANGTIQTSDVNAKTDIEDTSLGLDFIMALRPVRYRMKVGINRVDKVVVGQRPMEVVVGQRMETVVIGRTIDADGVAHDVTAEVPVDVTEERMVDVTEDRVTPVAGTRYHEGLIAQETAAALNSVGIDPATCGIWTRSDESDPNSAEGLRYEEIVGPLVKALQQLKGIVDDQAARLALLEARS